MAHVPPSFWHPFQDNSLPNGESIKWTFHTYWFMGKQQSKWIAWCLTCTILSLQIHIFINLSSLFQIYLKLPSLHSGRNGRKKYGRHMDGTLKLLKSSKTTEINQRYRKILVNTSLFLLLQWMVPLLKNHTLWIDKNKWKVTITWGHCTSPAVIFLKPQMTNFSVLIFHKFF